MPCEVIKFPEGGGMIVCSRGQRTKPCYYCERPHVALCDHTLEGGSTCDRPLCRSHAYHVPPDTDYCPHHSGGAESRKIPEKGHSHLE